MNTKPSLCRRADHDGRCAVLAHPDSLGVHIRLGRSATTWAFGRVHPPPRSTPPSRRCLAPVTPGHSGCSRLTRKELRWATLKIGAFLPFLKPTWRGDAKFTPVLTGVWVHLTRGGAGRRSWCGKTALG